MTGLWGVHPSAVTTYFDATLRVHARDSRCICKKMSLALSSGSRRPRRAWIRIRPPRPATSQSIACDNGKICENKTKGKTWASEAAQKQERRTTRPSPPVEDDSQRQKNPLTTFPQHSLRARLCETRIITMLRLGSHPNSCEHEAHQAKTPEALRPRASLPGELHARKYSDGTQLSAC